MTARSDLDNALQYVTDGVIAHVAALAAARDKSADDAHLVELTSTLRLLGDKLVASTAAL